MTALEDALRTADGVADRFFEGRHIPGLVYGVVAGGELVHSRGLGTLRLAEDAVPDADSVFRIASMTKSFTAATILSLRDEGRLTLDDPIAIHVPELTGLRGPTADSPTITVRHLMTMAAGLATDDPWGDRQQGLELGAFSELLRGPLTFAWTPGTRFEYSNLGYGILGRLITKVAGAEYRDVVQERLLRPLGMTSTGYLREEVPPEHLALGYLWRDDAYVEEPIDPYGALAAMGGIFTSVRDLARWVAFFTDAYPPRDDPEGGAPLSRATRREMQQARTSLGTDVQAAGLDAPLEISSGGYGYGLFVEDRRDWGRVVSHSGGYPGFGSNMSWLPASGLGVIVLTNHRYGWAGLLTRQLMGSLVAADAMPARRIHPTAEAAEARRDIERILVSWDDAVAARLFAMNVELDEPIARRRAAIERLADRHGPLAPDPDLPELSSTPLDASWWLQGERGGRVKVEISLSPESPPRVQTFAVTSVPDPERALAELAAGLVTAINAPDPVLPGDLDLGPELDRAALDRTIRIAGARFAPVRLGPAVAGDGSASATWRLRSQRGEIELAVTRDAPSGLVTALVLKPFLPAPPRQGD